MQGAESDSSDDEPLEIPARVLLSVAAASEASADAADASVIADASAIADASDRLSEPAAVAGLAGAPPAATEVAPSEDRGKTPMTRAAVTATRGPRPSSQERYPMLAHPGRCPQ